MSPLDELIKHKNIIALNIIKGFEQSVDDTAIFSEQDFDKAQREGQIEVFEIEAISAFERKIQKALADNPDADGLLEIEKAQKDLSRLVKVKKQDSKGRMMTYYVRATDKAKQEKEGGEEAGKKPLTSEQVGKKMAATKRDKHYILHHNDGSKIVVKRFGHGAVGEPNFIPVNENGEHQSDKAHSFPPGHIVDVEPHVEMDKKVFDAKTEKKRKSQEEPKGGDKVKKLHDREKLMQKFHDLDWHEVDALGLQNKAFNSLSEEEQTKVAEAYDNMDMKYQLGDVKLTKSEARRLRHMADTDPKKAYLEAKQYSDSYNESEDTHMFGQPISEIKAEYDAVMAYAKAKMSKSNPVQ